MITSLINLKAKSQAFFCVLGLFMLASLPCFAQKNAYLETDSTITSGLKLIMGSNKENCLFITEQKGDREVKHTPKSVKSYGLKEGFIYERKNLINGQSSRLVFMQLIEKGKLSLYKYFSNTGRTFYLQKDSTLLKLEKDLIVVQSLTSDCPNISEQIKLIKYSEASLKKFVSNYNSCKNDPLPFTKFGFQIGLNLVSVNVSQNEQNLLPDEMSFSSTLAMEFGVFADIPLSMSSFTFHPMLSISKSGFVSNLQNQQSDNDVVINTSSLDVAGLVRYTLRSQKVIPFIQAGARVSTNFRNSSAIYNSTTSNNVVVINDIKDAKLIDDRIIYLEIGIGLLIKNGFRHMIPVELNYRKSLGNTSPLAMELMNLTIGYSF